MQQRRQEVVDPAEAARRDIGNARQLRTRQLGCLQLLAEWRLRKASATGGKLCGAGRASVERGALYAHQLGRARQPRCPVAKFASTAKR